MVQFVICCGLLDLGFWFGFCLLVFFWWVWLVRLLWLLRLGALLFVWFDCLFRLVMLWLFACGW